MWTQLDTHFVFPFFKFSNFGGDDRPPNGDELSDTVFLGGTFDTDAIGTIVAAVADSHSMTNGWFAFVSNICYLN